MKQQINEAKLVEEKILQNAKLVETVKESAEALTKPMSVEEFTKWLDQSPKQ
jgi:hypothetical protein